MRLELDCICGTIFRFFVVGRVRELVEQSLMTCWCEMIIFIIFCLGKVLLAVGSCSALAVISNVYQQNSEKQ